MVCLFIHCAIVFIESSLVVTFLLSVQAIVISLASPVDILTICYSGRDSAKDKSVFRFQSLSNPDTPHLGHTPEKSRKSFNYTVPRESPSLAHYFFCYQPPLLQDDRNFSLNLALLLKYL